MLAPGMPPSSSTDRTTKDPRGAWAISNRGNLAIRQEFVRRLWEVAGPELDGAGRILEIGAAGGWLMRVLAEDVAPNRLVGIDIDPDRVAAARAALPGARFILGDARQPGLIE